MESYIYMKKDKLKILFIGAGSIAIQHLKVLDSLIDLKNCWICSRSKNKSRKIAKLYSMIHIDEDYYEFIKQNKKIIDGIVILVSMDQIFFTTKKILSFKIPLFVEKPPGLSITQLQKLNSLSKKYNTPNLVGYNRRYYSVINKVKKKLASEKIISAHIEAHERYWILKNKVKKKTFLKKWVYANTSHVINLLLFFLGDYKKVIKFSQNNFNTKDLRINTSALIEFNKKIYVTFKSNWNVIGGWYIKIFSNKNTYLFSPLEQCVATNKKFKSEKILPESYDKTYKAGFYLQAIFFLSLIKKGNYYNDFKNILSTYKLIKKIFDR